MFVGHGVMFTNDLYPRAVNADGSLQTDSDWTVIPTTGQAPAPRSAATPPFLRA